VVGRAADDGAAVVGHVADCDDLEGHSFSSAIGYSLCWGFVRLGLR
jgi:hypothetical protein